MGNNEMMLGIHGTLHIVCEESASLTAAGHRARIGIRKRYLLVLGLHHLSVQDVQTLYFLAQRCNLLIESRDLGLRYRFPLAIGGIKLREVASNALINLRQELSLKVGDGGNREGGISWGGFEPPLRRPKSQWPGAKDTTAN